MAGKNKGGIKKPVVEALWPQAEALGLEQGLELVDIEYIKEAGQWVLRIYIDNEEGISHEHCSKFSNAFGEYLDEADIIPSSYILEVSSPGLERPLKKPEDFQRFAGREVLIGLYAPLNGQKEYQGELLGLKEGCVIIKAKIGREIKEVAIPCEQIGKAHLIAAF